MSWPTAVPQYLLEQFVAGPNTSSLSFAALLGCAPDTAEVQQEIAESRSQLRELVGQTVTDADRAAVTTYNADRRRLQDAFMTNTSDMKAATTKEEWKVIAKYEAKNLDPRGNHADG